MTETRIELIIDGVIAEMSDGDLLGFVMNFEQSSDIRDLEINIDTVRLVNNSREQILNHRDNHGVFVGIPAQIRYNDILLDYYIDLRGAIWSDYSVEVSIKKRKGNDNFLTRARNTSFELMFQKGINFSTINIPYVIIKDNQAEQSLALIFYGFNLVNASVQAIRDTEFIFSEFTASLSGSPALAISAGLKLALHLAYLAFLAESIITTGQKVFELVFPNIRYFKTCKVKELMQKACSYLGYGFSSTLLDSLTGLTILPVPLKKKNKSIFNFKQNELDESFNNGHPSASDSVAMIGQLFAEVGQLLNAKPKVVNGVVQFERIDYWENLSSNSVAQSFNVQEELENKYSLNDDEAFVRAYLSYQVDPNDMFTRAEFEPADVEKGVENTNQIADDLNLLTGLYEKQFAFSLGSRKNEYNFVEKIALELFGNIDVITGGNLSSLIEDRIGVLQISEQFFSSTKLLYIGSDGKQPSNFKDIIKASVIYDNYHSIMQNENRGFKEFDSMEIPFNYAMFESMLNMNYLTINGENCEIIKLEHIPNASTAVINYRLPYNYSSGKITTFAIND